MKWMKRGKYRKKRVLRKRNGVGTREKVRGERRNLGVKGVHKEKMEAEKAKDGGKEEMRGKGGKGEMRNEWRGRE